MLMVQNGRKFALWLALDKQLNNVDFPLGRSPTIPAFIRVILNWQDRQLPTISKL
jgi:hypothetical protein